MIILALDASSETCSAALSLEGKIDHLSKHAPREHTQRFLPMIRDLLAKHHIKLSDCSAIAFGEGPGSFTGLRIATSVAQGLAFAEHLPLVPVSTLAALARAAQKKYPEASLIVPALDARMHEIYFGLYGSEKNALIEDTLASPQDAAALLEKKLEKPWVGIGRGFLAYPEAFNSLPKPLAILESEDPNALEIAELSAIAFSEGRTVKASDALPKYLRNEVAHKKH